MEKYYIQTSPIKNKPGQWNSTLCEIYNSKGEKLGEYIRHYNGFAKETFFWFTQNEKDYALYSGDYNTISVMSLPDCKPIKLNPDCVSQLQNFCPVEIYVPRFKDSGPGREQLHKAYEEYDNYSGFSTLGFVAGCVWGDDSSWKLNLLDLSNIDRGELWYVDNSLQKHWLYRDIPIPLSELHCEFELTSPFPYAYNQVIAEYQDFNYNITQELKIKEHDIVVTTVNVDSIVKETKGVVVYAYEDKETFEVEFFKNKKTLGVHTVKKHQLKKLNNSSSNV